MLVEERLNRVMRDQLGSGYEWSRETSLTEDQPEGLALDSLDLVELVMVVEEEFALQISDDECGGVETVDDIIRLVENKLEAKQQ